MQRVLGKSITRVKTVPLFNADKSGVFYADFVFYDNDINIFLFVIGLSEGYKAFDKKNVVRFEEGIERTVLALFLSHFCGFFQAFRLFTLFPKNNKFGRFSRFQAVFVDYGRFFYRRKNPFLMYIRFICRENSKDNHSTDLSLNS